MGESGCNVHGVRHQFISAICNLKSSKIRDDNLGIRGFDSAIWKKSSDINHVRPIVCFYNEDGQVPYISIVILKLAIVRRKRSFSLKAIEFEFEAYMVKHSIVYIMIETK